MNTKKVTSKKAVLSIFIGVLILIVSQGVGAAIYFVPFSKIFMAPISAIVSITIGYSLIKLYCNKVMKMELKEFNIGKIKISTGWLICGILLPVAVLSMLILIPGEMVKNNLSDADRVIMVVSSVFVVGLSAGVVEEMIFRGLIMGTLEKAWGRNVAIVVPSMIFAILHSVGRNMGMVDILLLLVAGTSVGIMLSLIVYESGSVWNSAFVHSLWNTLIIGGIISVGIKHDKNAIFSYKLLSNKLILTGGKFGIESSIISVIAYMLVIVFIAFLMKKKSIEKINDKI